MLDGWIRSGAYGSIVIRPAPTSALMSRSESNMAATLAADSAALGQSVRRLISSQWSPIDTMEPSLTRTRSPIWHLVDTPPLVVTVDPLVDPRSTTNAPSTSVAMAGCDFETVRVSSAILINWASSSPGWGCGFRPSSTSPLTAISRPSSSTTTHPIWAFSSRGPGRETARTFAVGVASSPGGNLAPDGDDPSAGLTGAPAGTASGAARGGGS